MTEKEIRRIELLGTIAILMVVVGITVGIIVGSAITEPDTWSCLALVVSFISWIMAIIGGGIIYWLEERFYA